MHLLRPIVVLAAVHGAVSACGICPTLTGDGFALPHPRALEIAVATRTALDRGRLAEDAGSSQGWNRRDRSSSRDLVRQWAEETRPNFGAMLHVVLVDTSEAFVLTRRGATVWCEPGRTERRVAVLATTRPALQALRAGRLRWDEALAAQLAVFEKVTSFPETARTPESAP